MLFGAQVRLCVDNHVILCMFERLLSGKERQSKDNTRDICFSFSFK